MAVSPSTEATLRRFLGVLELEHLLDDPRFATNDLRVRHRAEIDALIEERLARDGQENWVRRLNAAGVPHQPVQRKNRCVPTATILSRLELQYGTTQSVW